MNDLTMLDNIMFIEVKAYGDFDMPYTSSIWAGNKNRMQLISEFAAKHDLEITDKGTIRAKEANSKVLGELTKKLESFIKSQGFKHVKTNSIIITD